MDEEPSFRELLARMDAGNDEATELLCAIFLPHVERVIRRQLREAKLHDMDPIDVRQSAVRRLLVHRGELSFTSAKQFCVYLSRCAKRIIAHELRTRDKHSCDQLSQAASSCLPANERPLLDVLSSAETVRAVRDAVTDDEWEILQARAAGRTWQQIADTLRLHPAAARMRFVRFRERLRRLIKDH